MTKKTKFPRTFRDEYQNWSLLAIIEIKTKLKLTYAVYCALPSSIIKYMSHVLLFYITSTYNIYI